MKINEAAGLKEIRAYLPIGERLGTAGQPTVAQLGVIREAGFGAVINLALATSDNAIAEEGSLVAKLGMAYVQIPVNFQAPRAEDFRAFCKVMEAFEDRPVFVHLCGEWIAGKTACLCFCIGCCGSR